MIKRYTKKQPGQVPYSRKILRIIGIILTVGGLVTAMYIFIPLVSWQIFLAPKISAETVVVPIPKATLVTPGTIVSLFSAQVRAIGGTDYTNANNWFPSYTRSGNQAPVATYTIAIPRLKITHAEVSTTDTDLAHHLVNLEGTSLPPHIGNTVIFGHSTLPQLYNPLDYKTIFAYAHTLQVGDTISVDIQNIQYTYKIFSITVVDPDDTSVLQQDQDDSYLTIITCTPPGTIWKRLVIKARLEKL